MKPNDEIEIDLGELLYVLRKRIWIIIAAAVICAGITGLYTKFFIKPTYTSSTMLYIVSKTTTLTSLADLQLGTQLTKDYKVMVTSRPVTAKVIKNLNLGLNHNQMLNKVSVTNQADTRILTISVVDTNPMMAKIIADEFAEVASEQIAEIMNCAPPNIVEEGYVPDIKTGPSLKKNTALGGLVGIVGACGIILMAFILNDSVRTADDVERYLGLTTLGIIPDFDDAASRHRKEKKRRKKIKGLK